MICRFIITLVVALSASTVWAQQDIDSARDRQAKPNVVVLLAEDLGGSLPENFVSCPVHPEGIDQPCFLAGRFPTVLGLCARRRGMLRWVFQVVMPSGDTDKW